MPNLYIAYPDIPSKAVTYNTGSGAYLNDQLEDFPAFNIFRGYKWQKYRSRVAGYEHNITWDCGLGNARSANFLYLAGVDALIANSSFASFKLQRSSDGVTYNDVHSVTNVTSASLLGPQTQDYINLFTASANYRYWRLKLHASDLSYIEATIHKCYFGRILDLGDCSDYSPPVIVDSSSDFLTASGASYYNRLNLPRLSFSLTWENVTDANTKTFFDEIYAKRDTTPVALYTDTYHDVLGGHRLVFAWLKEAETSNPNRKLDKNNITASFMESIG